MKGLLLLIIVVLVIALRVGSKAKKRKQATNPVTFQEKKPISPKLRKFYTVWVFFNVSLKRVFRDRVALFFTFLFPLIFLFVFGGLNSAGGGISLNVAIINESHSQFAQ